jgi:DNA polymerase V
MQRAIALVDCNNFYVSCERVFQPRLKGKPVVVLSNNDGCVVSRSQEVKELGIKMALPWYQMKDIARKNGIVAFSSNYTLYAELSNRVMSLLSQFAPNQEVYSIDESFLDLTGITTNLTEYGQQICSSVQQWVGIPVCIGIAPSKTLAKLANHVAKKKVQFGGVCNFNALEEIELNDLFASIEVGEVWGVGRSSAIKLNAMGIHTVFDLKHTPFIHLQAGFSVVLERIIQELNGVACLKWDDVSPDKQQIICSRSFGTLTSRLPDLEQAVISYTTRAAEKLRQQRSLASGIQVYIRTNPHKEQDPQYQKTMLMPLHEPTDDTHQFCHAALAGLRQIFKAGFAYQKAGVMLTEIIPVSSRPQTLFDDVSAQERSQALMRTMDRINRSMGSGTIKLLGEGIDNLWAMRRQNVSKQFTTKWNELALCKALP